MNPFKSIYFIDIEQEINYFWHIDSYLEFQQKILYI